MKTLSLKVSFFASISLSHCFSRLPAFLYSMPFRNNKMHCEIIDRYFNEFVEIQLKEENLKSIFWAPKPVYQSPKRPEYVTGFSFEYFVTAT